MLVPLSWLNDYIDLSKHSSTIVCDTLTALGFEVEHFNDKNQTMTLNITPNRPDCLGIIGVARELANKLNLKLKVPEINKTPYESSLLTESFIKLNINSKLCPRFVALYIENITNLKSPKWIEERLVAANIRPISLVVDITNYVMLEFAQPIHAYDYSQLEQKQIGVRFANKDNETLTTLDGQERKLSHEDIVIDDGKRAVGLAGVMGGENSQITDQTNSVLIEVACFDPILIRKTSKSHHLQTDASYLFERGVDIQQLRTVAYRVAELIYQCSQEVQKNNSSITLPKIASKCLDFFPNKIQDRTIALRPSRLSQISGLKSLSNDQILTYLEPIGVRLVDQTVDRFLFAIPSWRHDLEREIDLIEEVLRIHGFDKIPSLLPKMNIEPNFEDPFIDFCQATKKTLASFGLSETVSYSFVSEDKLKKICPDTNNLISLANPINDDLNTLRPNLLVSLLSAILENKRWGTQGIKLFELGRVYLPSQSTKNLPRHLAEENNRPERPNERLMLGLVLGNPFEEKNWQNENSEEVGFFNIKNLVEQYFKSIGLVIQFKQIKPEAYPYLHPYAAAEIYFADKILGYIAKVNPITLSKLGLEPSAAVCAELDLELVFESSSLCQKSYKTQTSIYPPSSKDVAFLCPIGLAHQDFETAITAFDQKVNLSDWSLFDIYQGTNVEHGKKSMAYRFYFQSSERTLTENEIDNELKQLILWLNKKLNVKQR